MAARSQGQVLERAWKSGRGYALRFRAYGERQYVTLGLESEGWDRDRADEELANILADVRRGIWVAPERTASRGERIERGAIDGAPIRSVRAKPPRRSQEPGQPKSLPLPAVGAVASAPLLRELAGVRH